MRGMPSACAASASPGRHLAPTRNHQQRQEESHEGALAGCSPASNTGRAQLQSQTGGWAKLGIQHHLLAIGGKIQAARRRGKPGSLLSGGPALGASPGSHHTGSQGPSLCLRAYPDPLGRIRRRWWPGHNSPNWE